MSEYKHGHITKCKDGTFTASYLCKRSSGSYQAIASRGLETIQEAKAAIDESNGAQREYLSRVDAVDYEGVRALGRLGVRWYKPSFWGPADQVLTVVHIGGSYILSRSKSDAVYLSMGNADCKLAFHATGDVFAQVTQWVERFEATPAIEVETCHYCGQDAIGFGFFGEPICPECGG